MRRLLETSVLCISLLTGTWACAQAQRTGTAAGVIRDPGAIAGVPAVRQAMTEFERDNAWTLNEMVSLCEIPAPPFKEAARAAAYRDKLVALGLQNVRIDSEGNVIGEIRGVRAGPTVLLSGHLDTVFPEGTDVTVKRDGTRLTGPGIGDDCRGLAVNLAIARQVVSQRVPFAGRILIVGTVGEEGAGNLRGVRAIFTSPLRDSIDYFLSVDGTGFGITNGAVGSNRYRIRYVGRGGHSFGAFGMPNPIHAMGRAIAGIAELQVPAQPRTTFNVGVVEGGTSVNTISALGAMDVDLRSESPEELRKLDSAFFAVANKALRDEIARWPRSRVGLTLEVDTIGIRPAGQVPDSSFIVRTALEAAKTMNVYAPLVASSTDANFPMSLGIPSITLDGGGVGVGGHSLQESYDDRTDGFKGPQWVLLVVLGLTGVVR